MRYSPDWIRHLNSSVIDVGLSPTWRVNCLQAKLIKTMRYNIFLLLIYRFLDVKTAYLLRWFA